MDELMDVVNEEPIVTLGNNALNELPKHVDLPRYDRKSIKPGILHIGLGNFHRAHQAWYMHRLMQQGEALDWGIIGAGVRPYDVVMREKLLAQDCLFTLIELGPSGTHTEVVGSIIDYLPVEPGNGALIEAIAQPAIRIVAMTVTEGGYYVNPVTGGFDEDNEDIQHDISNPDFPCTAFGAIIAALGRRRANGVGPMTLQSCDNLQGNGAILRQTIVTLAKATDPDLAEWIDKQCSFPNSMVDCIVPATGPDEIALARSLGIQDQVPVTHENYRQWVIEDDFCAGRPPWQKAGVTFTNAVHDYEAMKIRILNAGHQVIANAAEIMSIETIDGCMENPDILAFFHKVEAEEIVPYIHPVPDITPGDYVNLIAKRFANSAIRDTTRRVAFDGSSRHTGFVLPIVRDALAAGGGVSGLALVEALWARMCEGTREDGSTIDPNDPHWDDLVTAARAARERPQAWLEQSRYYGELAEIPEFADAFAHWHEMLWREGCAKTLQHYAAQ